MKYRKYPQIMMILQPFRVFTPGHQRPQIFRSISTLTWAHSGSMSSLSQSSISPVASNPQPVKYPQLSNPLCTTFAGHLVPSVSQNLRFWVQPRLGPFPLKRIPPTFHFNPWLPGIQFSILPITTAQLNLWDLNGIPPALLWPDCTLSQLTSRETDRQVTQSIATSPRLTSVVPPTV